MADASKLIETHLGTKQRMFNLSKSGGTAKEWRGVARVASATHAGFAKIPGREREARAARADSKRANALANMAVKGKIGEKSHPAIYHTAAPGAMKAVRGGAGGGGASGS